jgi:transcriptional regulator with XRE-family HTH domain
VPSCVGCGGARRKSVRGLARLAGVAPSTVTRWESGSTAPRLYELYALLAALDVCPDEARAVREAFRAAFGSVKRSGQLDAPEKADCSGFARCHARAGDGRSAACPASAP